MNSINKYGLSRNIPEPIRRMVRQRDGFGCVVCGRGFFQYDHFEPEFSEAKEHNADGIILLCEHCHGRKNKRLLSNISIAAAAKNPMCKRQGFSFGALDVGNAHPKIILGKISGYNADILLRVLGDEILSILPPEYEGGPFRINARMADRYGNLILEIIENEWRTSTKNWDVEWKGPRVIIRKKRADIILSMKSEPPDRLIIERLNMLWRGTRIAANANEDIEIITPLGAKITVGETVFENCKVGVDVTTTGIICGCGGNLTMKNVIVSSSPPPSLFVPSMPNWWNSVHFTPSKKLLDYLIK